MPSKVDAWFLYARKPGEPRLARLVRERFDLPDPAEDEVQVEPLFGSWEGNMGHALERSPVDICRQRGENRVILGNSGVFRIVACGRRALHLHEGQLAIGSNVAVGDRWGYPIKIHAYDAPLTMGMLATRVNIKADQVIPLPQDTKHCLRRWAAFSLRYVTAWSNWELAHGVFRLSVERDEFPCPHVWGWGGGTTLAELTLARKFGCRVVMLSGNEAHRRTIELHQVQALDRTRFEALQFEENRYLEDASYRQQYVRAEAAFLKEVKARTEGEMVQIFVDYIGGPVYRATLKSLGREGVITTAGWREGMVVNYLRAVECIDRHQHVHSHYARWKQCRDAVAYAEENDWLPILSDRTYSFDEIPLLAESFVAGNADVFPIYAINPV